MNAATLTALSIDWLRERHPDAVIVTELSVLDWGGASIDVAAIAEDRIVGIEIKGEGDGPSRLQLQGLAYGLVAKEMWLLCAASVQDQCFARKPDGWGRLEVWEGRVRAYNRHTRAGQPVKHPEGYTYYPSIRDESQYWPDKPWVGASVLSPVAMCQTLWRDELHEIAKRYQLTRSRSITVGPLTELILASLPLPIIHQEMLTALRSRQWRKPVHYPEQAA